MISTAFGEPTGQGWTQLGELGIALALSLIIGIEREVQQKAAGVRTYTLVGLGSALFVLVSKYGFTDVLTDHVVLDPSRVAAQIVSGVGFIGGGVIFVRRDAVRGLTTAASVWVVAAVGAAAAAGLPVLATAATAGYFLVLYGTRPLLPWIRRLQPDALRLEVEYLDGRGLLRDIVTRATGHGFAVVALRTHATSSEHSSGAATVTVSLHLTGRAALSELTVALSELDGVLGVRAGEGDPDA